MAEKRRKGSSDGNYSSSGNGTAKDVNKRPPSIFSTPIHLTPPPALCSAPYPPARAPF